MRLFVAGMISAFATGAVAQAASQPPSPATSSSASASASVTPLIGGRNFISPAGEPVRSKDALSGAEHWFRQADANGDGRIVPAEFRADFDRFFMALDTDHDGEIGPDEIERYETEIAPEIRVASSYGDPQLAKTDDDGKVTPPPYPTRLGAGRFGYLDMPEPIVSADANIDRAISRREMAAAADKRFHMLDINGDGAITRDDLPKPSGVKAGEDGPGPRQHGGGGRHGRGRHGGYVGGEGGL